MLESLKTSGKVVRSDLKEIWKKFILIMHEYLLNSILVVDFLFEISALINQLFL